MKNITKKLLTITCSAVLCLTLLSPNVYARDITTSKEASKLPIFEQTNENGIFSLKNTGNRVIITDKEQIKEIATQQNLNDPESITQITYEYRNLPNIEEYQELLNNSYAASTKSVTATTAIYNVKDLGTGFSYWDQYDSSIYAGPAEVTKTYKRKASSSYSADITVNYKLIEAAVGFTINSEREVSESYKLTVPANKKIELRVFTNYQKKSYDIGDNLGGLIYYCGSGTAQRPVGLIFQQIQR